MIRDKIQYAAWKEGYGRALKSREVVRALKIYKLVQEIIYTVNEEKHD